MFKKLMLLILSLVLMSCATPMSMEEKCKKADQYMDMARVAEPTNLNLAIKHTLEAVKLCPTGLKYAYMAKLDADKGYYDIAVKVAEAALKREPDDASVLTLVGQTYFKVGKNNEAIPVLGKALLYEPNNALARNTLATIYLIQRDFKKAENEFLKNTQNNPQYTISYYMLGKLYMDELDDQQKAYEYLSKFMALEKGYSAITKDARERINKLKANKNVRQ